MQYSDFEIMKEALERFGLEYKEYQHISFKSLELKEYISGGDTFLFDKNCKFEERQ